MFEQNERKHACFKLRFGANDSCTLVREGRYRRCFELMSAQVDANAGGDCKRSRFAGRVGTPCRPRRSRGDRPTGFGNCRYGYTYDTIGNRLTATENSSTRAYTANALNQYTSIASATRIGDRCQTPVANSRKFYPNYGLEIVVYTILQEKNSFVWYNTAFGEKILDPLVRIPWLESHFGDVEKRMELVRRHEARHRLSYRILYEEARRVLMNSEATDRYSNLSDCLNRADQVFRTVMEQFALGEKEFGDSIERGEYANYW